MNKQVESALQKLLAASGPVAAWLANRYKLDANTAGLIVELAVAFGTPIIAAGWGWISNRAPALVSAISNLPPEVQAEALNKVTDAVKVKVAEAVPGVATVVVKDGVNGELGALAASPTHPNIVTETQNELDAKQGTKVNP